jgi:hypothetical protein
MRLVPKVSGRNPGVPKASGRNPGEDGIPTGPCGPVAPPPLSNPPSSPHRGWDEYTLTAWALAQRGQARARTEGVRGASLQASSCARQPVERRLLSVATGV